MLLYQEASRILQLVEDKKGSVKNLSLTSKYKNKKQLYALVCESVKYSKVLQEILDATKLQKLEKSLRDTYLAKTLLYDFLFGNGLNNAGKLQDAVVKHSSALRSQLAKIKAKRQVVNDKDLLVSTVENTVQLPRYVRVNTLKTTVDDVIESFRREDYRLLYSDGLDFKSYMELLKSLDGKQFVTDLHIPQLLVFAPGTDLHEHVLYTSGDIILQDKASCLPALVLDPPSESQVIDCCAAPGNKTTFLAALMSNKGKIFAFDKDAKRLSTMNTLSLRAGALCIESSNKDFLCVDSGDPKYCKVKYILVDPSCSGSGIVGRNPAESKDDSSELASRLKSLSNFQTKILSHAMSFPNVERVVYSTCSVHKEENENVVNEVLQKFKNVFELKLILPLFPSRGNVEVFSEASRCVSMSPHENLTNGFFIACFERVRGVENKTEPSKHKKKKKRKNANNDDSSLPKEEINKNGSSCIEGDVKVESNGGMGGLKKKKRKKVSKNVLSEPMEVDSKVDHESSKEEVIISAEDGNIGCVGKKKKVPTATLR